MSGRLEKKSGAAELQIMYQNPEGDCDPSGFCYVTIQECKSADEARAILTKLQKLNPRMKFAVLIPALGSGAK